MAHHRPSRETELDQPVRDYLTAQGYTVRSEVQHCDLVAVQGEAVVVVELKRSLNLTLLTQAVQRQKITPSVYVAVPRPANKGRWLAQQRDLLYLLRRLELGLILVGVGAGQPPVEIIQHPAPHTPRRRTAVQRALLQEVAGRSADFNCAGSCRRKLVTAYRENAIRIACCLAQAGPLTPRRLRALGTGPKTLSILYKNVYGWFARTGRGLYALTDQGRQDLAHYPALVEEYRLPEDPASAAQAAGAEGAAPATIVV